MSSPEEQYGSAELVEVKLKAPMNHLGEDKNIGDVIHVPEDVRLQLAKAGVCDL